MTGILTRRHRSGRHDEYREKEMARSGGRISPQGLLGLLVKSERTSEIRRRAPAREPGFSVIVLAGGRSTRMGRDKAFLLYRGRAFISTIVKEALEVSDEVIVVVGPKRRGRFARILPDTVSIVSDSYHVDNPMGGVLSAFEHVKNPYAAVLACDLPLVKSEALRFLHRKALGHSAAVPVWDHGASEPLCAVYSVRETKEAGLLALNAGQIGPRRMLSFLRDPQFVNVSELRDYDRDLGSLLNINSRNDYRKLRTTESSAGAIAELYDANSRSLVFRPRI